MAMVALFTSNKLYYFPIGYFVKPMIVRNQSCQQGKWQQTQHCPNDHAYIPIFRVSSPLTITNLLLMLADCSGKHNVMVCHLSVCLSHWHTRCDSLGATQLAYIFGPFCWRTDMLITGPPTHS